jgi:hypothetical protein
MTKETDKPKPAAAVSDTEKHRRRGKAAAREMLLARTRRVCLTRDCPTSKNRLCEGMVVRLPNDEADALVKARAAKEIGG